MRNKLTVCVFTDNIPSCPSTALIEKTISSFPVRDCRIIISYDQEDTSQVSMDYFSALKRLPYECYHVANGQQRKCFLNAIERVETPYFLQLEHDWQLVRSVNLLDIVDCMERNQRINAVYFNKRANLPGHNDGKLREILVPETEYQSIPLLKTSRWTNNPGIIRTQKYVDEWVPLFKDKPFIYPDKRNKQIEPFTHWKYIEQIEKEGFEKAHRQWGTYIYGNLGDSPSVLHLDGRTYRV